jgi:hypothetical protein
LGDSLTKGGAEIVFRYVLDAEKNNEHKEWGPRPSEVMREVVTTSRLQATAAVTQLRRTEGYVGVCTVARVACTLP